MNQAKLDHLTNSFTYNSPLPIRNLDGTIIFTDGHTRAFLYHSRNHSEIPVYWDEDELDEDLYKACLQLCESEGIKVIGDLKNRLLPNDQYEVEWIQKCVAISLELSEKK
ncbi:hypothetical protein [Peribacillus deserti]|uniref:Uncharacterized protein n=1 Tax=Peribacillus deserti TaxID=673318 RepID=A0A2N5M7H9_9BACI|nr:hypothetical protein [Peribacillus deserti]PLT30324.1 hypothetical protein CUU66_08265 [Peribacillus deserti]